MLGKTYQTHQKCWIRPTRRNKNVHNKKDVPDVSEMFKLGKEYQTKQKCLEDAPDVTVMLANKYQT